MLVPPFALTHSTGLFPWNTLWARVHVVQGTDFVRRVRSMLRSAVLGSAQTLKQECPSEGLSSTVEESAGRDDPDVEYYGVWCEGYA